MTTLSIENAEYLPDAAELVQPNALLEHEQKSAHTQDEPVKLTPAQQELAEHNMGMAYALARKYGGDIEENTGYALEGLVKAAKQFDPSRGLAFSTLAQYVITGSIKHGFRDGGLIKNRRQRELSSQLKHAEQELQNELGRFPTDSELQERTGLKQQDITARHGIRITSLDSPIGNGDDSGTKGDMLADTTDVEVEVVERGYGEFVLTIIDKAVNEKKLQYKEAEVLRQRLFYSGDRQPSQADVAANIGISQMHVSRLESRAIGKLRSLLKSLPEN